MNYQGVGMMQNISSQKIIKFTQYALCFLSLCLLIYFWVKSPAGVAFAVETTGKELGISTFPSSGFLQALNMAPGDRLSENLTVVNQGTLDFSYNISAVKQSGDDPLYNVLDLTILDKSGNPLYAGKLKDLKDLALGILGPNIEDMFKFQISFPAECGNEYQALNVATTFVLNAKEHPDYLQNGEILWDPPLEKPDVAVRHGTIMPIRFHILKEGVLDTVKRGIELVISGENAGEHVEYIFKVTDGTLGWKEHGLNKPHYVLLFNAENYPVDTDTYYTATVKYGEQVLGKTMFKSGK